MNGTFAPLPFYWAALRRQLIPGTADLLPPAVQYPQSTKDSIGCVWRPEYGKEGKYEVFQQLEAESHFPKALPHLRPGGFLSGALRPEKPE